MYRTNKEMTIVATGVALGSILAADAIWLSVSKNMYAATVRRVQRGSPMRIRSAGAFVSYVFVGLAFVGIVLAGSMRDGRKVVSLPWAAFVGFVVYGTFNATNVAIFSGYDVGTAVTDTLWGTVLFAIAAFVYRMCVRKS